jgi:LSD1 subclass zinc finger protein
MMLTCPTCRSGLEVPDGTTAMVRCPTCKTVFSPAAGLAPPEPEVIVEDDEDERPRRPKRRDDYDDEDDRPRRKPARSRERDRDEEDDNEGEPEPPKKRRRRVEDENLSPEEKRALRASFDRAAWGSKLIWASFIHFVLSMLCIIGFWFQNAFSTPSSAYVVAAGVLGAIGWVLAAIGVGLCLSGPPSPGHWGYGIAAAVATALHLMLLVALATKGTDYSAGRVQELGGEDSAVKWGLVPTRLDAVTFYLTYLVYRDQEIIPKGEMGFSIVVGIAEIIRTTLILMMLSCLARATGDEELSHKCTRAAGFASFGPGFMAAGMLLVAVILTEAHAGSGDMAKIILSTIVMGTYAVLCGCVFPGLMAAREVADACDEPYQAQLPQL